MSANSHRYNVGGILLDRPFKIRRLGHFGFNVDKLEEARAFYADLLGFTISDRADFSRAPWFPKDKGFGDCHGYFMRYGSDHHAMVLFAKPVMDQRADRKFAPEVTINQITWQCGSLREIVEAYGYFQEQQVRIQRVGRDMPGSNWHSYVYDPDGHTNELYYGIEQVGWNQASKPQAMYYRGFQDKPDLPQMSEAAELAEAQAKGIDIFSGYRPALPNGAAAYDVDGVLLPRPFKITKIGPVRCSSTMSTRPKRSTPAISG
jgi:catechol 2,3-dioxygenase-like lactoylglutathione lyase family enzyme